MKIYEKFVRTLDAIENCRKAGNDTWLERHENTLADLLNCGPSGGGVDHGTELLRDECKPNRLVFQADFHHMDETGMYDGWSEHKVIITPSLGYGIGIRITGRDRNGIKEYLGLEYGYWLESEWQEEKTQAAA